MQPPTASQKKNKYSDTDLSSYIGVKCTCKPLAFTRIGVAVHRKRKHHEHIAVISQPLGGCFVIYGIIEGFNINLFWGQTFRRN